jgi:hypothetical protein
VQDKKKKQSYLKYLYLNIGFILAAALLIYFVASVSIKLFQAGESERKQQQIMANIQARVENFDESIKNGNYQKAYDLLNSVIKDNTDGKYDRYISDMTRKVADEYNLLCQSLYGETVNDSIAKRVKGITVFEEQIKKLLEESIENHYKSFIGLQSDYQPTINFLRNAQLFELFQDKLASYINTVEDLNRTRSDYQKGVNSMARGEYAEAISYFQNVPESDIQFYTDAQKRIEECHAAILKDSLEKAQLLIDGKRYQDALTILNNAKTHYPDNAELLQKINYCRDRLAEMNLYQGPIYHVFFHSLIVYPELAFDGDYKTQGYNDYMVTVDEFVKILNQLYERNYILVDINDLFETYRDNDHTLVKKKDLYLPKGKKPLVLSIDDVSYYEYMKGDGFASRLVVDDQGKIATAVTTPDGSEIITYDGDVMPIVDAFVEKHPDFSYLGAKGIIALTGYEGVLGYRTNLTDAANYASVHEEAKRVADALKSSGWRFANHSYSHNDDFSDGEFELVILEHDTERWKREVEPITGPTNIYITPFGYQVKPGSDKYEYLTSQGYEAICGVGGYPYHVITEKALIMDRQNIDGVRMFNNPEMLADLFDVGSVIDRSRPFFD